MCAYQHRSLFGGPRPRVLHPAVLLAHPPHRRCALCLCTCAQMHNPVRQCTIGRPAPSLLSTRRAQRCGASCPPAGGAPQRWRGPVDSLWKAGAACLPTRPRHPGAGAGLRSAPPPGGRGRLFLEGGTWQPAPDCSRHTRPFVEICPALRLSSGEGWVCQEQSPWDNTIGAPVVRRVYLNVPGYMRPRRVSHLANCK